MPLNQSRKYDAVLREVTTPQEIKLVDLIRHAHQQYEKACQVQTEETKTQYWKKQGFSNIDKMLLRSTDEKYQYWRGLYTAYQVVYGRKPNYRIDA